MKNLNVAIEESVLAAVKVAAKRDGMLLRKWVERALEAAARATTPTPTPTRAKQ